MKNELNTRTVLQRFQVRHVLYWREFQETKAGTGETITFWRNKRKRTTSTEATITAIKLQVPVAGGSLMKAFQPLHPTVPKEEDSLDTAVPAAHVELKKNLGTAFAMCSNAMKAV